MKGPITTDSLVLKTFPYRDTDAIVTLLSATHGRISAVARSAKNSKKRFSGGIDIFDCGIAELSPPKGRSDLLLCTSFERQQFWLTLRKSLLKLSLASLAAELILCLTTDNDENSHELYPATIKFFSDLDETKNTNVAFSSLVRLLLESLTTSGYSPLACAHLFPEEITPWWSSLLDSPTLPPPQHRETIYHSTTRLVQFAEKITEKQFISRDGVLNAARSSLLAQPTS